MQNTCINKTKDNFGWLDTKKKPEKDKVGHQILNLNGKT